MIGGFASTLGRATDLGPRWRAAFERRLAKTDGPSRLDAPAQEPARAGSRVLGYLIALAASAARLGWATNTMAALALARCHHRGLIAALVGTAVATLVLPAAARVLVLARALSAVVPFGPRVRLGFAAAPWLEAGAWSLGLALGASAVAVLIFALERRPHMPPRLLALNAALWAPALLAMALAGCHLGARQLWRLLALRAAWSVSPLGLALCAVLPAAVVLAGAVASHAELVRQLDLRPWRTLGVVGVAALLAGAPAAGRAPVNRPRYVRVGAGVLVPVILIAASLVLGERPSVRKAAINFTGLGGPLISAIQTAWDLDRDGYSPVLGGGDCNDFDSRVHPGAFDWPDDGIDQDCNGHQATLVVAPRPPFAPVPATVPAGANVVLLTIDAVRADHLGAYGYARPTSPNLDALARESVP